MSLYNLLHGRNPLAPLYLAMLGLGVGSVPRFRDVYLWKQRDGNHGIAVHTRTGGGNRDFYEHEERCRDNYPEYFDGSDTEPTGPWNADLRRSPLFVYDEDDDFDSTYATFYYRVPAGLQEQVNELADLGGQTDVPAEAWQRLFRKLRDPDLDEGDEEVANALETMRPIVEQIVARLDTPEADHTS